MAAISACAKGKQLRKALELREYMQRKGWTLTPSFTMQRSAQARRQAVGQGLGALENMQRKGLEAGMIPYRQRSAHARGASSRILPWSSSRYAEERHGTRHDHLEGSNQRMRERQAAGQDPELLEGMQRKRLAPEVFT